MLYIVVCTEKLLSFQVKSLVAWNSSYKNMVADLAGRITMPPEQLLQFDPRSDRKRTNDDDTTKIEARSKTVLIQAI